MQSKKQTSLPRQSSVTFPDDESVKLMQSKKQTDDVRQSSVTFSDDESVEFGSLFQDNPSNVVHSSSFRRRPARPALRRRGPPRHSSLNSSLNSSFVGSSTSSLGMDDPDETGQGTDVDEDEEDSAAADAEAAADAKARLLRELPDLKIGKKPQEFRKILVRMVENDPTLTEVDMPCWGLGADGAKLVAEALSHNDTLQRLDLWRNGIGSEGAEHVAKALECNDTLLHLDLRRNGIDSEGAKHIADALAQSESLRYLNLRWNGMGNEGARYVADALTRNSSLEHLDLWRIKMGRRGAKYVAEALAHNDTLRHLSLRGNDLGNEGAEYVAKAIACNDSLQHLDLDKNQMDRRAARPLATALLTNEGLQELRVNINDLSKKSMALLKTMVNKKESQTFKTFLKQSASIDDVFDEDPEQFWVFLRLLRGAAVEYPCVRKKLNETFVGRPYLFLTMVDFYVQALLVAIFSSGSLFGVDSDAGLETWQAAVLAVCFIWLALRELFRIAKTDYADYATDRWSWLHVAQLVMVALSSVVLYSGNPETNLERFLIIFTVGLLWLMVLGVLRYYFYGIAVFLFTMEQIVLELASFLTVSAFIISGFVHMNHAANTTSSYCSDDNEESFCKLGPLYADLYAMFFGVVEVEKIENRPIATTLSYAFGFLIGLLFLNVLIAKISNVFLRVEARGKNVFWVNRSVLLKEGRDVGKFLASVIKFLAHKTCCQNMTCDRLACCKKAFACADGWNTYTMSTLILGGTKDVALIVFRKEWGDDVSPKQRAAAFLLRSIFFPLFFLLWFLLGLVSAGLLWPKWMSSQLFFGPEEANELPGEKQLSSIAELDAKVDAQAEESVALDSNVSKLHEKVSELHVKVEELRDILMKLMEQNGSTQPNGGAEWSS